MPFAKVFPLLINKAEKKGRTREEVYRVISWLTGYTHAQPDELSDSAVTYSGFFENAPHMNENRHLITGFVCGVKLHEIDDTMMLSFEGLTSRWMSFPREKRWTGYLENDRMAVKAGNLCGFSAFVFLVMLERVFPLSAGRQWNFR